MHTADIILDILISSNTCFNICTPLVKLGQGVHFTCTFQDIFCTCTTIFLYQTVHDVLCIKVYFGSYPDALNIFMIYVVVAKMGSGILTMRVDSI